MATVSEAAINAAVQEIISLDCYCDYAYAFNIAKEYFQKHSVDIEEWLSTFNTEYEKTVKNPAPEPESVDDEIFVDDSDLFVDDAWVAEQEKVHALYEQEMHELRQRIFATPPEKFLKIIPFSKQSGQTVKPSGRRAGARCRRAEFVHAGSRTAGCDTQAHGRQKTRAGDVGGSRVHGGHQGTV
ncbi:hypothetical protein HF288_03005, partial [Acidithiobacillus caldus]|uniref:hypothetical protein n=1 Tax=Acidithiobacillus caldus TaxID=33059 RepID=UPI001C0685D7